VWAQTHRGFKSHRHRTMKTPDFRWIPVKSGVFSFHMDAPPDFERQQG